MAKLTHEEMSRIGRSNVRRSKSNERMVAKLLTAWSGVPFRRRRVEGRDSTVIERESTADVIPARGEVIFSIESKCGKDASLNDLMVKPRTSIITRWWHQACWDASLVTKVLGRRYYPLLFFKPHANWIWVAAATAPFELEILKPKGVPFGEARAIWFPHLRFDTFRHLGSVTHNVAHTKKKQNQRLEALELDPFLITPWTNFAAYVDPVSFFSTFPAPAIATPPELSEQTKSTTGMVQEDVS